MSKIIVDSCCDITPEMSEEMGIATVPLTMILGSREYCDDETLDVAGFVEDMGSFPGVARSAAPAPFLYQQAIETAGDAYVVTLSKNLSCSYENAVMGAGLVESDGVTAHVLDSKSASAGETSIAIKLYELIQSALSKEVILAKITDYINNMKTYFALENYDNLKKNGRLGKIQGLIVSLLNIKLVMGSDGNGEIMLYGKCRGEEQKIDKLLSLIENSGRATKENHIVISHVNNPDFAAKLRNLISERFDFKKIFVVPCRGLSSLYADNKGIVIAF